MSTRLWACADTSGQISIEREGLEQRVLLAQRDEQVEEVLGTGSQLGNLLLQHRWVPG
jgi:hypothetical protein